MSDPTDAVGHTPGPYEILYGAMEGDQHFTVVSKMSPGVVCEYAVAGPRPAAEVRANAHLFAASPDLLAACEYALTRLELADEHRWDAATLPMLRAAIAKAKGL